MTTPEQYLTATCPFLKDANLIYLKIITKPIDLPDSVWELRNLDPLRYALIDLKAAKVRLCLFVDDDTIKNIRFQKVIRNNKTVKTKQCIMPFPWIAQDPQLHRSPQLFNLLHFYPALSPDAVSNVPRMINQDRGHVDRLLLANSFIQRYNKTASIEEQAALVYVARIGNEQSDVWKKAVKKHNLNLPYMDPCSLIVYKNLSYNDMLSQFIQDELESCQNKEWIYGKMSSRFDVGTDDIFVNLHLLPQMFQDGLTIAYIEIFDIAAPFFYFREAILTDSRSLMLITAIFGHLFPIANVRDALSDVDLLFYKCADATRQQQRTLHDAVLRFWKVIDIYDDWFPTSYIARIQKFYGKLFGVSLNICRQGQQEICILLR